LLNVTASGICWLAPGSKALVGRLSAFAGGYPECFFIGLVIVSALIYFPLARFFEPWHWVAFGPFEIQPSLAPQYAVYFFSGLAVGAGGIDRGLLRSDGMLAQRWAAWLVGAFAAFLLWVVPAALIEMGRAAASSMAGIAREFGFVLFAASACFASAALFLRFANTQRQIFRSVSENSYGIYLFHYVFVIWTQYWLLQISAPAIVKGAVVLGVTLALSWASSASLSSFAIGGRLLRGERRTAMIKARASAEVSPLTYRSNPD
jgi:membrane-bound acyltransferase YfiQ involved in biofilm formation